MPETLEIPHELKNGVEKDTSPSILFLKFSDAAIPVFKETRSKDYIKYGDDNEYPDYLTYLFNKSPKHNAIIGGKAKYIFGKGYENGDMIINRLNESLNDISRKALLDVEIYGGFKLEIIWNRGGKISEIYHVDFSCIRKGKEDGFYYKECWKEGNRDEEKFIIAFNPSEPTGSQIYEYNEYRPGVRYYPLPGYIGSNNYIETDIEISKYYLSAIRNGMMPSKMIQFFKGDPTDEKKREIEKRFGNKFAGAENAGKFIMVFNDSNATRAVEINDLSATELDKQFIELNKTTQQEIFSGHLVTSPMLFGIKTEGQLGGNAELKIAYSIFQNTYAEPKANNYDKEINWLLSFSNFKGEYKLQATDPIGFQFDAASVINSLPKTFVFKELGIPEDMWAGETIGGGQGVQPINPLSPQPTAAVNDHIKNLTGRQMQGIQRIVRQYESATNPMTRAQAALLLKTGYGLSDEDIIAFLGEDPQALAMSFETAMVTCPNCSHKFDYNSVSESGMGYVNCPKCSGKVTQANLLEANIIAMFDACGDSKNDFEILKSKRVSFAIDEAEADEIIYKQEAFKTYDVTTTENKILELIKKDPLITPDIIAKAIGETEAYVKSKIKSLEKKGYLETTTEKIGSDEIEKHIIPKGIDIEVPPPGKGGPTQIFIKYSYEGPQDDRNRPFCAKMMQLNRLYSRYEIEQISQRLGYSVFDRRGGFWRHPDGEVTPYCRHRWDSNIVIKKGGVA